LGWPSAAGNPQYSLDEEACPNPGWLLSGETTKGNVLIALKLLRFVRPQLASVRDSGYKYIYKPFRDNTDNWVTRLNRNEKFSRLFTNQDMVVKYARDPTKWCHSKRDQVLRILGTSGCLHTARENSRRAGFLIVGAPALKVEDYRSQPFFAYSPAGA
jgi:hypothetical protein